MKKITFLSFVLLFAMCSQNTTVQDIAKTNEKHNSVHFKVTETYFYKGEKDTVITDYEVWLQKNPEDTLIGGYAWVDNKYRPYSLVYNLKNFYIAYPSKHKVRLYPSFPYPIINDNDWIYFFLQPEKITNLQNDSLVEFFSVDTVYENKKALKITTIEKKYSLNETKIEYLINPQTGFPFVSIATMRHNNEILTDILKFSDFEFDNVDTAVLNKKLADYIKKYPPIKYNPEEPEMLLDKMLQIGDKAPIVEGEFYSDGKHFNLENYKGKVIVLDFWYTHCRPCVMAIPELSKLYDEYHDKGLEVFGMNSIDNKPGNDEYLLNFCQNRNMSYPPIRTNSSVDRVYKIIGYPSMYVIDKDGNIAYVEVGFEKDKFQKMKQKVIDLLEE